MKSITNYLKLGKKVLLIESFSKNDLMKKKLIKLEKIIKKKKSGIILD